MPRKGELYKHKQIKNETYRVDAVDNRQETVYLKNTNNREQPVRVTFAQLANSYERA